MCIQLELVDLKFVDNQHAQSQSRAERAVREWQKWIVLPFLKDSVVTWVIKLTIASSVCFRMPLSRVI